MNSAVVWTVIVGLGLASALIRYSFLGFLQGREVPPLVRRALAFVPAAAFPAIFMPMVMLEPDGTWAEPLRPIAGLTALLVGLATRSMFAAIVAGFAALILLGEAGF
ncbi:MAG: AzlD domain-containing protein [Pseudomonadota bacterium]